MLELLELQARARAIRSQLALEPVTKIDLDSDDESNAADLENKEASSSKEKTPVPEKIVKSTASRVEKQSTEAVKRIVIPPAPPKTTPVPQSKPVKLKRNYKTQASTSSNGLETSATREPSPPKDDKNGNFAYDEDDDDVIRMEPSPETFFISDSDEEPPAKKSPIKREEVVVDKTSETSVAEVKQSEETETPEDGELSPTDQKEMSPEPKEESPEKPIDTSKCDPSEGVADDDVVHLMSDTEIELHHHSDKEEEEIEAQDETEVKPEQKSPKPQSDDDVVEINNSSDDEIMNDSEKSAGEAASTSETWTERWLSSSKTQNILKTTQLASKVRINMLNTRKTQKATARKKKESEEAEKMKLKEKISNAEEGSMEQFKVIKEKSN